MEIDITRGKGNARSAHARRSRTGEQAIINFDGLRIFVTKHMARKLANQLDRIAESYEV